MFFFRCNGDSFFAASLCPTGGLVDPPGRLILRFLFSLPLFLQKKKHQVTPGAAGATLVSTPVKPLVGSATNRRRWRSTILTLCVAFTLRISQLQMCAQASKTAHPVQLMIASGAHSPPMDRRTAGVDYQGFPVLQRILRRAQHLQMVPSASRWAHMM